MAEQTRKPAASRGRRRRAARLRQGLALLFAVSLVPAVALAPRVAAQEVDVPGAPDFSDVTTKAAARKLVREGRLVEITLFPAELGGADDPMNVSYTTPEAADVREMVIGTLGRFYEDGVIDNLRIVPEYKGDSLVPSSITMSATHSGREGEFTTTIEVW